MDRFLPILFCLFWLAMPFVSPPGSNIFGCVAAVFGMVALCAAGSAFLLKRTCRISPVDGLAAAYVLYGILHMVFGTRSGVDPFGLWEWSAGILGYCFVRSVDDRGKKVIVYTMVFAGLIQSLIVFGQISGMLSGLHPLFDATGSFGNPGQTGGFLSVCFILSVGLAKMRRGRIRILILCVCLTVGEALLLTDSRAGVLAALIGITVVFLPEMRRLWQRYKTPVAITLSAVCILFGILLYGYRTASADARLLIWRVSADMIADKLFTGHGIGSFNKEYMLYQADYFGKHPDSWFAAVADNAAYPYNEFIHAAIELGAIGLFLLCAVFAAALLSKSGNDVGRLNKVGLVGLIVFSCFSYPSAVFPLFFLFPLLLAASTDGKRVIRLPKGLRIGLMAGLFLVCLIAVKEWKFYRQASAEVGQMGAEDHSGSSRFVNTHFEKLVNNLMFNAAYIEFVFLRDREHFPDERIHSLLPSCETYCDIGNYYFERNQFDQAERYYWTASRMIPTRLRPNYLLWKLYVQTGMTDLAWQTAKKILSQPLKIDTSFTLRSKAEVREWMNKLRE